MRKWLPFVMVTTLVLALDQVAKAWVVANMTMEQTIEITPALSPYLQLTRSSNTGIAFGLFAGSNAIFLALPLIIVAMLLYLYHSTHPDALLQQIALSMVVGGALGNIIDRVRFGYVVDFVHVLIPNLISNVSNFADHFIVLGVILLLADTFWQERRTKQKSHESDSLVAEGSD